MADPTIWKASAINAKDPTARPTPSSTTKNMKSMASIMVIRVDFDQAMVKDYYGEESIECALYRTNIRGEAHAT